jgi:hypothetical protein
MRKVDRLKKLHAPIDDKYKKIDTTVNDLRNGIKK